MLKQLLGGSAARNARPNAHREATKRSSKFIVFDFTTHKLPYPSDSWLCLYSAAQTALLQQPTLAPSWQLAGASARRLKLHPPLVFSFSGLSEKVFSEGFHTNPHTRRLLGFFRAWLAVHLARFFRFCYVFYYCTKRTNNSSVSLCSAQRIAGRIARWLNVAPFDFARFVDDINHTR